MAYYHLAHKYHPDMARTPEEQKSNEEMMRKINHAYQTKNLQALKAFLD
jgi:DnaJ-class molecular chaperone